MHKRVKLFGIEIDAVNMAEAVEQLYAWLDLEDGGLRYVVTPNVDHAVMLQYNANLRRAYEEASLIVADGTPVVLASRLVHKPLPERVAGVDLVKQMFAAAAVKRPEKPLSVYLLGAAEGVAERAAATIESQWSNVRVVGMYSPPLGFQNDAEENKRILARIEEVRPDLLVVGLGAPKQEIWVHAHRNKLAARVALCVGATIDFLAGEQQRAPEWMQKSGVEWLHRVMKDPRRLGRRYAFDAWMFPQMVWREWWHSNHTGA